MAISWIDTPPAEFADLARRLWSGETPQSAAAAQRALLDAHVSSPFRVGWVAVDVPGYGEQLICTLEINPDADGTPIVWAHGAGAGLAFGYANFDTLANLGGRPRRLLAFDWLGQGNSSRPNFPTNDWTPRWTLTADAYTELALRFFVDSLEAWRQAVHVESMDLIAHSTGGYVAVHFALQHPHRVRNLVLNSAAGLGSHPTAPPADEPKHLLARAKPIWDNGWLHFGMVKIFGPLRETARARFVRFAKARMGIADADEASLLFAYFWGYMNSHPISSDAWTAALLTPVAGVEHSGVYGRRPIADEPAETLARLAMPVVCVFGSDDWIFTPSVRAFVAKLPNATLHMVAGGKHHLYRHLPTEFHALVGAALQEE